MICMCVLKYVYQNIVCVHYSAGLADMILSLPDKLLHCPLLLSC